MKTYQKSFSATSDFSSMDLDFEPGIILLFISPSFPKIESFIKTVSENYPNSTITGCSTSGEIFDTEVNDSTIVFNALKFEKTKHRLSSIDIADFENSLDAGAKLSQNLESAELRHILVFSDGLKVNGADLVKGLTEELEETVSITGGLAADGTDFNKTFTIINGEICEGKVIGLGLYGPALKIGYSSKGGWDSFGMERIVTHSENNVLFELDGEPALDLYKSFLGEKAAELPSSGLLFPLSMRTDSNSKPVVRTILAVDEKEKSLTFAGSIPKGSSVRLMKANVDRLINGAEDSAKNCLEVLEEEADFALLISCVGRRLVLRQMVEEEVEAVRDVLGKKPVISGFYSYGELAPFGKFEPCLLHNQTMTITTFSE